MAYSPYAYFIRSGIFFNSNNIIIISKSIQKTQKISLMNQIADLITQKQDPQQVFQLLDILGQGSYGSVSKALHKQTGQLYAIKILPATSGVEIASIKKQISILKQCDDDHIVRYYGSYFKDNNLWIVMQYCIAGSITDIIQITKKKLNQFQIASILESTLKGLQYIHTRKKIHRDIKAANILLDQKGNAKLADFGVSASSMHTNARFRTHIGSPYWMSPQIIKYSQYDNKTDIWSLGITAIELAQGQVPNSHIKPFMAIFMIRSNPVQSLKQPQKWSPQFNDFIRSCLQINPSNRPQAKQLLQHQFIKKYSKGKRLLSQLVLSSMQQIQQFRMNQSRNSSFAQIIVDDARGQGQDDDGQTKTLVQMDGSKGSRGSRNGRDRDRDRDSDVYGSGQGSRQGGGGQKYYEYYGDQGQHQHQQQQQNQHQHQQQQQIQPLQNGSMIILDSHRSNAVSQTGSMVVIQHPSQSDNPIFQQPHKSNNHNKNITNTTIQTKPSTSTFPKKSSSLPKYIDPLTSYINGMKQMQNIQQKCVEVLIKKLNNYDTELMDKIDGIYREYREKVEGDVNSLRELKEKNNRLNFDIEEDVRCRIRGCVDWRDWVMDELGIQDQIQKQQQQSTQHKNNNRNIDINNNNDKSTDNFYNKSPNNNNTTLQLQNYQCPNCNNCKISSLLINSRTKQIQQQQQVQAENIHISHLSNNTNTNTFNNNNNNNNNNMNTFNNSSNGYNDNLSANKNKNIGVNTNMNTNMMLKHNKSTKQKQSQKQKQRQKPTKSILIQTSIPIQPYTNNIPNTNTNNSNTSNMYNIHNISNNNMNSMNMNSMKNSINTQFNIPTTNSNNYNNHNNVQSKISIFKKPYISTTENQFQNYTYITQSNDSNITQQQQPGYRLQQQQQYSHGQSIQTQQKIKQSNINIHNSSRIMIKRNEQPTNNKIIQDNLNQLFNDTQAIQYLKRKFSASDIVYHNKSNFQQGQPPMHMHMNNTVSKISTEGGMVGREMRSTEHSMSKSKNKSGKNLKAKKLKTRAH